VPWDRHPDTKLDICDHVSVPLVARMKDKTFFAEFDERQMYLTNIDCAHIKVQEFEPT
jgi:hypothetical protein